MGVAEYTTPEHQFGYDFTRSAYNKKPLTSKTVLLDRLRSVLHEAPEKEIERIIS